MRFIPYSRLTDGPQPGTRLGRVLRFPALEFVAVVLFLAPVAIIHNLTMDHILRPMAEPYGVYWGYLEKILNVALFLLAYRLYVRWVEGRSAAEISRPGAVQETAAGFLLGGGIIAVMVLTLFTFGFYQIESLHDNPRVLLDAFLARGVGAFVEELAIRLILFRLLEKLLGTWFALGITALTFALGHYPNPDATVWSSAAIALSDLILAGAFVLTRRLWLVWGIHFGWNYVQDGVFGMANSGVTDLASWINPTVSGPEFLTGGNFGVEASYVAVGIQILIGVWLLKAARERNQIVRPRWASS